MQWPHAGRHEFHQGRVARGYSHFLYACLPASDIRLYSVRIYYLDSSVSLPLVVR